MEERQFLKKLHKDETRNTHTNPASCTHLCLPEFSDTLQPGPPHSWCRSYMALQHTGWEIRIKGGVASALTWKVLQPSSAPLLTQSPTVPPPCEVLGSRGQGGRGAFDTSPASTAPSTRVNRSCKPQTRQLPWRVCRTGPCMWVHSHPGTTTRAPPRGRSATSWGVLLPALVCWQLRSTTTSECSSICLMFSEAENLCVPQKSNGCSFHKLT